MKPFLFLLVACLLSSCGKERTIVITATNAITGERYPGLEYSVVSSRVGAVNGEGTKTVASGVLNANGEAVVELHEKRNRRYAVRVVEPANTCYNKQINMFFDSPFDENGHFNFEFAECAYLKFRYNNVNCIDANDHIEVTRVSNLSGYTGFNNPAIYNGCQDYTMPNFVQVPMGYWFFTWEVTKNGITNNFSDTIFLSPNEQRFYEFNY
ncbi:MAG: hypothetical protein IT221_01850 [Fluviicola sp.]|nr:hypothetical protein [Fluviicola sp.]